MRNRYWQQETIFTQIMNNWRDWEYATADSRRLAIAADAELRRRHPDQKLRPLQSAEPPPVSDTDRDQLNLASDQKIGEMPGWIRDLAAQRDSFREKLEERLGLMMPNQDPDCGALGKAFPAWQASGRDAILQPPKPEIVPSASILQLVATHDISLEAAD